MKFFFIKPRFKKVIDEFKHKPMKFPIIILIDNDKGSTEIFSTIKENYKITITTKSNDNFFHITDNLYLVKTPPKRKDDTSCIEDLFPRPLLKTVLEGKKFNPNKDPDPDSEYGKFIFAEKVVKPNADTIDFSGFEPLLTRITAVMDHYTAPAE